MRRAAWRITALLLLATSLTACTGEGINAGEDGGQAFIALFGMLVVGIFLFWFFLGRDE